jgi:hypothetical protein
VKSHKLMQPATSSPRRARSLSLPKAAESWTALYMVPEELEYCSIDCSIVDLRGLGR